MKIKWYYSSKCIKMCNRDTQNLNICTYVYMCVCVFIFVRIILLRYFRMKMVLIV